MQRHTEDGLDAGAVIDGDVVDQVGEHGFGVLGAVVVEDVADVGADLVEQVGCRCDWCGLGELVGQVGFAVVQFDDAGGEGFDPWPALFLGHGAFFEGEKVAVDGLLGGGDLATDGGEVGLELAALVGAAAGDGGDGVADEVGAGVGPQEGFADGVFEVVGA